MQISWRLHYQMVFGKFPKFPNIMLTFGVIAMMAVCDSFHTKQSSTLLITALESYIKSRSAVFLKNNPVMRYTLVLFKVHDNSANKIQISFRCVLRCDRDRAPFVAKPAMRLLGAMRKYCEVTSSLKYQSNVEGKISVNLFKIM